jgi:3-hydroxyacyl-CoA dehydrogenase
MDVKKQIFAQLDQVCKPGAFLCSNTSALNIDEIASATSRPEFVMGTHFFSPANVMKLLENVRGAKTSDETIASMMEWGKKIGKWCILVGNCPGFVGNRMVGFYGGQARVMLEEGLSPTDVDGAVSPFQR